MTQPTDLDLLLDRMTERERITLRETAELLIEAHGPDCIPAWALTQTAAELLDTDDSDPQVPTMRRALAAELREQIGA